MNILLTLILLVQALFIFRFHFNISAASPFIQPLPLLRKVTDPFLKPLVKFLKDPAHAQVLPIIVGTVFSVVAVLLVNLNQPFQALGAGLSLFFRNWLNIIMIVVFINVILSWVGLFKVDMPIIERVRYLVHHFCEPMLAPLRRLLPPMSGIDFSPMILLVGISLLLNVI